MARWSAHSSQSSKTEPLSILPIYAALINHGQVAALLRKPNAGEYVATCLA